MSGESTLCREFFDLGDPAAVIRGIRQLAAHFRRARLCGSAGTLHILRSDLNVIEQNWFLLASFRTWDSRCQRQQANAPVVARERNRVAY